MESSIKHRPASKLAGKPWTRREIEVIRYVAQGLTNKEIAAAMSLSDDGIKSHLRNISQRSGVGGRQNLVNEAWRRGYLDTATPSSNPYIERTRLHFASASLVNTAPGVTGYLIHQRRAGLSPAVLEWVREAAKVLNRVAQFTEVPHGLE